MENFAFVLAVIFIFVLVNFISNRRHHQWDLTKSGKFTLASLSQAVARKVDKPLTVTAFYSTRLHGAEMRRVEDLLKQYKAQNGKIDPDKTMALLKGWSNPNSPRGPIMIDPVTRDIVQNEYLRRLDMLNGRLSNVEVEMIPQVKDPWVQFNPPK